MFVSFYFSAMQTFRVIVLRGSFLSLQYTVGPWKTHRQNGIGIPTLLSEDEGCVLYPIIEKDEKSF